MTYTYKTRGTCSSSVSIDVAENGTINAVEFNGGCNGNLQGISNLAQGEHIEKIIDKLKGIRCGGKETSCPDQLAKALEKIMGEMNA